MNSATGKMNILTAGVILQLLLIIGGSDASGERKRLGCYYLGDVTERYGALYPEDIDASICTHVVFVYGGVNYETQEIILQAVSKTKKADGESYVPRLVKLKGVNPDLKLILHVFHRDRLWLSLLGPSEKSKIIENAVKWLNVTGFDGMEMAAAPMEPEYTDLMADFLCEMKNEFDKYGYSVSTALVGADPELTDEMLSKIVRCNEHIKLLIHHHTTETHRIAPMSITKPSVDFHLQKGVPASKIVLLLPIFGAIYLLEDPNNTTLGAGVRRPGNDDLNLMNGVGIRNKELLRKMNDSSLQWTIHRDNETQEPYAFSRTGLWVSYEDTASMEYKARYVMQEGLGGFDIVSMEYEDDEGIGGQGRFPLTRTVYDTFRRGNQTADTVN